VSLSALPGDRQHERDLPAEARLGAFPCALPRGDAPRRCVAGVEVRDVSSPLDATLRPRFRTPLPGELETETVDALAQRRSVDDLAAARRWTDAQDAVALDAGADEPVEDPVGLATGPLSAGDGAIEPTGGVCDTTAVVRAVALQSTDLAVSQAHRTLRGHLTFADGGCRRGGRAARLDGLRQAGRLRCEQQQAGKARSQEPPQGLPVKTRTCGFDHGPMLSPGGDSRHHPSVRVRRGTFA
jgi:hypothetical protein